MATKKTASTAKKTVRKAAPAAKKTTTKVTTVSAAPAAAKPARFARLRLDRAPLLASSVVEFIGTFLLASVVLAVSGQPLFVMFAMVAIVLVVGGVSGAHLNPALTIGALVTRRVSPLRALAYVVAQVLGAVMALVIMNAFVSAAPAVSEQAAAFGQSAATLYQASEVQSGKEWVLVGAELLGTTILAFAVAAALRFAKGSVQHAGVYAAGLYVAAVVAGTGAAVATTGQTASQIGVGVILNPALAASLQALQFQVWPLVIYVVTPLVGAVLGFALSDLVKSQGEEVVA